MSETNRTDTDDVQERASRVAAELQSAVTEQANPVARALEESFAAVGQTITRELEEAARRGRLTMQGLVDDVLADLARLTAEKVVREPLEQAIGNALQGAFGKTAEQPARSKAQLAATLTRAAGKGVRNG